MHQGTQVEGEYSTLLVSSTSPISLPHHHAAAYSLGHPIPFCKQLGILTLALQVLGYILFKHE